MKVIKLELNYFLNPTQPFFPTTKTTTPQQLPHNNYPKTTLPQQRHNSTPTLQQHHNNTTGNASLDEILLFERSLPSAMIFPEALQCPKCDFSNRVRINIVKHLRYCVVGWGFFGGVVVDGGGRGCGVVVLFEVEFVVNCGLL